VRVVAGHPLTLFALVCLALFLNQICFNAYVMKVHSGDPSFVARYLPSGWFALSRGPLVTFVASQAGDSHMLAPSVLNAQAFLELPFVLTAYLTVSKMLGGRVYYTLTRLPILYVASASFTITFCLVEIGVPNPWTTSDVVIRSIACVVVPPALAWIARGAKPNDARPSTVVGLFAFLAGAAAMAWAVLAIYDAFLLYNFGHTDRYAFGLVLAFGVMAASARYIGTYGATNATSSIVTCARDLIATFTVVFFVPSLVLRYQAFRPLAMFCGFLVVTFSFVIGMRRVVQREASAASLARLALSLVIGLGAGAGAAAIAAVVSMDVTDLAVGEEALARIALAFLGASIIVARGAEWMMSSARRAFLAS